MDTVSSLREEIETLREEVRYLKEIIAPSVRVAYTGLAPTRADRALLVALAAAPEPVSQRKLRHCLDIALDRFDGAGDNSVRVAVMHLRRQLTALDPPITIRTLRSQGFWLDNENKALLKARRV